MLILLFIALVYIFQFAINCFSLRTFPYNLNSISLLLCNGSMSSANCISSLWWQIVQWNFISIRSQIVTIECHSANCIGGLWWQIVQCNSFANSLSSLSRTKISANYVSNAFQQFIFASCLVVY